MSHQFFEEIAQADVIDLVDDLAGKQPLDSDLTSIAGLSPTNDDIVQRKSGAWASRTPAQLKTDLALSKSDVGLGSVDNTSDAGKPVSTAQQTALDGKQNLDSDLTAIAGLTATTDSFIQSKSSAWSARTPTQVAADLVTPLSSSLQPLDSDLTAIAALTPTNDDVVQRKAGAWTNRSMAQVKTDLALVKADVGLGSVDNTSDAGKPISTLTQAALDLKQPLDSDLTTLAGLTATTDSIIQSKASAWSVRTPAQFKTDLVLVKADVGLGSVDNLQQQPLDADLTTIAGLTATTDNFLQSKASAWASRTPAQVAADLVTPLSSSLQPLDADLTTIAGLTATTDSFIQSKSSAWSARTLAQVRADIVLLKPFPPVTLTPGTTPALDASLGTHFRLAMAQNPTIGIPSNATDGQVIVIEATSDGTARTLALNGTGAGFYFGSDITALTQTAINKTDFVQAVYRSSVTKWFVIGYVKGF